ncbi:MAG: tetratricopeptide repeat protein [Thermodesulfobacteriota bacterium]
MWGGIRICKRGVIVLLAAVFLGCAAANPNVDTGGAPDQAYSPKIQPGMTFDIARQELADVLGGGQGPFGIKYHGRPGLNEHARQSELMALLKGGTGYHYFYDTVGSRTELTYVLFKSIPVVDDRIEISPRLAVSFTELIERPVTVQKSSRDYAYVVDPGLVSFHFKNPAVARKFADALLAVGKLQANIVNEQAKRLAEFEALAAQYRALAIKPPVSEEQRKLIVQANALNQIKNYNGAVDLYLKAVELDPVSYPGAYFNLALLSAQLERYNQAIAYMRQYLLLVPEAPDARSAQDKIYEWEIMMQQKRQG